MSKNEKSESNREKIRAEMQLRRIQKKVKDYIQKCLQLSTDYLSKGKQAAIVDDSRLVREFARGYQVVTKNQLAAERILMTLESLMLNVNHDELSYQLLEYAIEFDSLSSRKALITKDHKRMMKDIGQNINKLNDLMNSITHSFQIANSTNKGGNTEDPYDENDNLDRDLNRVIDMMRNDYSMDNPMMHKSMKGEELDDIRDDLQEDSEDVPNYASENILRNIERKLKEIENYLETKMK